MKGKIAGVVILFAMAALGFADIQRAGDPLQAVSTLDPRLQRLLAATSKAELRKLAKTLPLRIPQEGEPTVEVLIQVEGHSERLLLPGVTVRTRIGNVVTATVTLSALKVLAVRKGIIYIEPSIRLKRLNNIGTGNSSGLSGTLTKGSTDVYLYNGKAGQMLTISMHAGTATGTTLDPFLKICTENPCSTVLASDNDSGPGTDAQLTLLFSASQSVVIFASDATGNGGDYKLVFHNDPSYGPLLGIGAKTLHAHAIEGQGVIVGVIDTGIDWCHEDFRDDLSGRLSRILFLWDQNLQVQKMGESRADVGNDGNISNDYGVEYTQVQINGALTDCGLAHPNNRRVRSADTYGHGSHVAGTAAGDGSATNGSEQAGTYKGVAPKADLVIVALKEDIASLSSSASLIDAIAYIFAKADQRKQAAVINMSLGGRDGPADGTSLLDQAIRNATGPGRIIVVAAGNEGSNAIHAAGKIDLNGSDTITISFDKCARNCPATDINLWHSGRDAYTATLTAPNGQTLSVNSGATRFGWLDQSPVEIFNAVSSPPNGDKNIWVTIGGSGGTLFKWKLTLQRKINGGDGTWDAWLDPDYGGVEFSSHVRTHLDGSVAGTIGEPASSFGALAVGAHSTKFRWDNQTGTLHEKNALKDFGNIAQFSSRGPIRDGRIKPDITAPGNGVMSTRSADCQACAAEDIALDGKHMIMAGTSMATPMVTGAVALILQMDPNNFPRPLLKSIAARDSLTDALFLNNSDWPNNVWGSGKVNLANAMTAIQNDMPPKVSLSASPTQGEAPLAVTLTASASDPDWGDGIAEYLWDVDGDGTTDAMTTTTVNTLSKNYVASGLFTAKVTVVDQHGKTSNAMATLTVVTTTTTLPTTTIRTTTTSSTTTTRPSRTPPESSEPSDRRGCFIATAAYGSYLDPHVQTLRAFRDHVLLQSAWGKSFIAFYYAWSPPVARFITDRPFMQGMTRLALTPVVFAVAYPKPAGSILIMIMSLLLLKRRLLRPSRTIKEDP